ncbi:nucleotide pyrophosphohydrolase [Candidatus Woesearchaeota archaeon]|nr:nucleotide pyrophosphohydrolase [Candidatus Woesearchaeota archaeon]
MEKLQELVDLVRRCRIKCPWCREQTVESFAVQVVSEAKELEQAIKSKDARNIREELGDLLWDVIMLMHIAEHKGMFKPEDVIKGVNEKMKRRKPYIISGEEVTIEHSMKLWREEKEREKKRR